MATHEVSTWAQLVSAITSAAAGDVIKLIADIDCNGVIPEGVGSTIQTIDNTWFSINGEYTENGVVKRHEIRNLRTSTSSPVTIFKFKSNYTGDPFTVKGIDFINLMLTAPLAEFYNGSSSYTMANIRIQNCRFTGKRTNNLIIVNKGSYARSNIHFERCYFNIPYNGNTVYGNSLIDPYTVSGNIGYMTSCRIRETFTGTYTPSNVDSDATCSVYYMALSGCRVEGEVVSGKYPRYHSDNILSGYTPSVQNVYDVDFKLTSTASSVPLYAFKGVVKVPVRKKDAESTTYTISSASTGVILADESQMKDTDWLIQQGFDIVPSNQGG